MGRPKLAKNVPICPWLSAKADCREGRFIQIGNSLLLSKKYQGLSSGAQKLYFAMAMESGGKPTLKLSHGAARKKYGIPGTTYDRAVKELISKGFVVQIFDEHRSQFRTNEFRFAQEWKNEKNIN